MNCYLCGTQARSKQDSGGELVTCSACGMYKISVLVLKELGAKKFNYSKMRDDLHRQRQFNATLVAEINTETAIWA